jgi:hypothetical protein
VPNMGAGHCLGPEGNGVSLGRGLKEGPAPQNAVEISSQRSVRKEATWRWKKKEEGVGRDVEGPTPTEGFFCMKILLSVIMHDIKSKLMLHLLQENKSCGVETIALTLCLHIAVRHVPNSYIERFVSFYTL